MTHSLAFITSSGRTLSVQAIGTGPTLLLLHGFPLDHRMWLPLMNLLSPYYHCISMDFRGFGNSTLDSPYSLGELAEDVEIVRQHLAPNQQIHLMGLSMGGYVAMEYWHLYPSNLRSLILVNTKPNSDDDAGKAARRQMAQQALEQGAWLAISPMMTRLIAGQSIGTKAETAVQEMMRSISPDAVAAAQEAMANRRDFSHIIQSCSLPTLVVTGQEDPIAPPQTTRLWAQQIPGSSYDEVAGAGHLSPLEKPHEFLQILTRFLTKLGTS